jgi:tetratricopeptide (TPR) repeat protein
VRLAALLALALAASPARAWRLFGEPSDGKIRPVQRLNDEGKHAAVLAALTPQYIQTLRGTDLRQAYVLLGDNHAALGHEADALGDYQLGVSLFPQNVDLLTRLGALLLKNGLDERAKPLFQTALLYEPRHWGAHLGLAEIDKRFGFYDRAADHYEIAIAVLSGRADVWRDYAEVLLALHEPFTAELALRKAMALDPKDPAAHVLLAFVRRDQNPPDFAGADAELDAALALGADVGARRAKALILLDAGRLEAARAQADEILKISPGDGAALWVRARALLAAGDERGAARALAEVSSQGKPDSFSVKVASALGDKIQLLEAQREEALYRK